ncbi:hypothetical protein NIES267_48620 [Calothrix parasitica NIES-267]|uniref:NACHT C-terminal Cysteine and Histidine-containing domain-containing protein n=1 Tax=Calothrix parasitica NIES-267 TaxID=1973488 RepID=A0A1Z4LVU1_9CYAN|nr:hypothetical protein NIES267_48620 [Calothrix parasitica NIES-267]
MNDWKYFFDHELNNPEQGNYRIFASDSKVEILHWFSRDDIPKQQKEDLIRALVNFDDNCGGFYRYRAYFLAAEALNYFPECSFGDAIVKQLLDWSYLYFGWKLFPQPLVEAARKTLEVTDKTRVVKAFELLLRNTPSRLTLQSAATKLGELDSGNKMAIAALILLLDVTEDIYKLKSICKSISKIGFGNQAAINTVVELMETIEDKNLCREAIKTLGKIGCRNQTAILALEKFLQINRGDRICLDAAEALLLVDKGNEVALDALVFLLESTQELYLLIKAVEYLQEIDSQNQAAIKVLSERLKSCKDDCLRAEIAASLGKFDRNQPGIKEVLIEILETSQGYFLMDLEYFRNFGDNELYSHRRIISSLLLLYPGDKEVIASLISFLEKDWSVSACFLSISALRNMSLTQPLNFAMRKKIISAFIRFLQKNKGKRVRVDTNVAEAILQLEPDNKIAIDILIEIIQSKPDNWIEEKAPIVLLLFDSYYQTAINRLIKLYSFGELGVLLEYKRLFSENGLEKIVYKDKTVRLLIDDAISLGIKRLLNAIRKDKKLCSDCNYITDGYYNFERESFWNIWRNVDSINKKGYSPKIITALKEYLSKKFYYSNSSRYDEVYQLMWNYAENMSYKDFYQAWHG